MNRRSTDIGAMGSAERLALLEAAVAERAVVLVDAAGLVSEWSPRAEALTGQPGDGVLGRSLAEFVADGEALLARAQREGRLEESSVWGGKDGPVLELALTAVHGGGRLCGYSLVLSAARTRPPGELRRLETLGRLAGGVAHDFNNLLSVVLSYADLIHAGAGGDGQLREDVEEIRRAARRAAELTGQLLLLARSERAEPQVLEVDRVVGPMTGLVRRLLGEAIEVVVVPAAGPAPVLMARAHLEQVILSLVLAASDAMPTGGRLTLEVHDVDGVVSLSLSDSGPGGREVGSLAELVAPWGGSLAEAAGPGGTCVCLRLPRHEAEVVAPAPVTRVAHETVLLVEDEEHVRKVARTILRREGYLVLDAHDAREALSLVDSHPGAIDLLLTDVVMPSMSGAELARQITARCPNTKVIFMSGYTDERVLRYGLSGSDVVLLHKPITPDILRRKVRAALDPSRGG